MILVVDDTPANIDIVMSIIGDMDEVAVALDGEEALEIVDEEKPDLILLDIVMPGLDGFQVCEKIKGKDATSSIPVVFLSGNGSAEERAKADELGASGFLTKPIDPDELRKAVESHI